MSGRCIFTMIDRDNDGKFTDADNPPVEFTTDNLAELQQYLLAGGDTFCSQFFSRQTKARGRAPRRSRRSALATSSASSAAWTCFDFDGDTIYDEERPCADNKKRRTRSPASSRTSSTPRP